MYTIHYGCLSSEVKCNQTKNFIFCMYNLITDDIYQTVSLDQVTSSDS